MATSWRSLISSSAVLTSGSSKRRASIFESIRSCLRSVTVLPPDVGQNLVPLGSLALGWGHPLRPVRDREQVLVPAVHHPGGIEWGAVRLVLDLPVRGTDPLHAKLAHVIGEHLPHLGAGGVAECSFGQGLHQLDDIEDGAARVIARSGVDRIGEDRIGSERLGVRWLAAGRSTSVRWLAAGRPLGVRWLELTAWRALGT